MATQLISILTWSRYFAMRKLTPEKPEILEHTFQVKPELNDKISLWQGDITKIEVDAIVNAANSTLLGGGGVDGAIHAAAGEELQKECFKLNGCKTGEAKITKGYKLPAKYVIHTVGPTQENRDELENCYANSFALMLQHSLKSIVFPCISTGIYGYDPENAAHAALYSARKFLIEHHHQVERVIFCIYRDEDLKIYEELMQRYFPVIENPYANVSKEDVEKWIKTQPKHHYHSGLFEKSKPTEISAEKIKSTL